MNVFQVKKSEKYAIVVGCGRLGASLANAMSDHQDSVMVIDKAESAFRKLSASAHALCGMPVFDSLLHAMCALSTTGYSTMAYTRRPPAPRQALRPVSWSSLLLSPC